MYVWFKMVIISNLFCIECNPLHIILKKADLESRRKKLKEEFLKKGRKGDINTSIMRRKNKKGCGGGVKSELVYHSL